MTAVSLNGALTLLLRPSLSTQFIPKLAQQPFSPGNPGCVASGCGLYAANGIHEAEEAPIAGVLVTLRSGQCSADAPPVASIVTGNNGAYTFDALAAGDYCVTIALDEGDNTATLVPGGWTQPPTAGAVVSRDITLALGEEVQNMDFGWDYQ